MACLVFDCSAGWSWRLELEWCERKTLLPGWSSSAANGMGVAGSPAGAPGMGMGQSVCLVLGVGRREVSR